MLGFLKQVPLFAELSEGDLAELASIATTLSLEPGDEVFAEGSVGDAAFIVKEGVIEIFKITAGREVLLAVSESGAFLGEISLLDESTRTATGRARGRATLLRIGKQQFSHLLETSSSVALALFRSAITRWRWTEATLRQSEKLAQLGTLTAGVAHELNNPAAAARRGAQHLAASFAKMQQCQMALLRLGLTGEQLDELTGLVDVARQRAAQPADLDPLQQSDQESEMEESLDDLHIDEAWELAPPLVSMGLAREQIRALSDSFTGEQLSIVLAWLAHCFSVYALLAEIDQGASRISEIVKSMKSYTYLDEAPLQEIDVHQGLDSTLVLMRSKLRQGITVERDYAADLPCIQAYGSELNQVWTNIIDNACVAMDGEGKLSIRTRLENDLVVIEVADNGPGIPEENRPKVFDPFFTTKAPGEGAGLGLHISYNIIVDKHRGQFSVASRPGRTTFTAKLPLSLEDA